MGLERRIDVGLFRSSSLNPRLYVDVLIQTLGKKQRSAAHSNHQKYYEGDASRERFTVQHRPHQIRAVEGGDPRPKRRVPTSSTDSDSSTISKKCCHLFGRGPLDSGHNRQGSFGFLRIFFRLLLLASDAVPVFASGQTVPATILRSLFMAVIYPFRAWRYDPERVPVQQAVTQPYDKITPAMQESYCQASPYNLVRIILGKHLPGDGQSENVYTRAAAAFQSWRQTGILRRDPEPSIYRYCPTFKVPGRGADRKN